MSQVSVVTGGTRGIGLATVRRLAQDGYRVVAIYGHDAEAAAELTATEGVPTYRCDVADFGQCEEAFARIEAEHGPVELLVNNAGITRDRMCHRMTVEDWRAVLGANLDSMFNTSRQVLPGMRSRRRGRIINISSINGQKGQAGQTNYSAAKAGVLGFTRALAQEVAGLGVTVNAIAPGYVETAMTGALPADVLRQIVAQVPAGRLGTPDEIAACVSFLASKDAAFMNGATLSINGGQYFAA